MKPSVPDPDSPSPSRTATYLQRFLTKRFVQFCFVGASGVLVNLLALFVFRSIDIHPSIASALAIQVSILSNFIVHEAWTFRDKREHSTAIDRLVRFQGVSLVGALIQWSVFFAVMLVIYRLSSGAHAWTVYLSTHTGDGIEVLGSIIARPPPVGAGIYLSQLVGIGVATGWNFVVNFSWTWGRRQVEPSIEN